MVTEPCEWLSLIVVVSIEKTPGEVRITIDSRCANKVIVRTVYVMPTTWEIAYDVNGSDTITRLDKKKAFNTQELPKE